MDEATSTKGSPSSNEGMPNDEAPLWQYVTKIEKPSGSTVKSGIRVCPSVTPSHRLEMQQMHDQVENDKLERERRKQIPLPPPPQAVGLLGVFPHFVHKKRVIVQIPLMVIFLPGYNALRTTLLQREKAHVDRLLKPIKDFWVENGVSIVSMDGRIHKGGLLLILWLYRWRFASVVIMLKRLKLIKRCLQAMAISEQWASYREDDVGKAQKPNTYKPCLHLVYEMWDSMIEKVKIAIYRHEGLEDNEYSSFWSVVYDILIDRWTKNCTPLHCLAHSLNPRYYSTEWLLENSKRIPPHRDHEISMERSKCLDRFFEDVNELNVVKSEFAAFSGGRFPSPAVLTDRWVLQPLVWWQYHGSTFPTLQTLALKLLGQPCSSSCAERNWSTYKFIHSLKRNKMAPARAEDLVYVHSNLRLLSRRNAEYINRDTKMWDIAGDSWNESDIHGGAGILENAALTLDEPELEAMVIGNVSTSVTTSESEVRSEAIDLEDDEIGV
ncbi:uncharacterized protein LOC142613046 [Castanea sativa]|uniref:uncharacterized protein LOC142613046 n=1 Tax=Castanea sativa TaxID=21020 RepID=UPI003F6520D5